MQAMHAIQVTRPFPGPGWYYLDYGRRHHYFEGLDVAQATRIAQERFHEEAGPQNWAYIQFDRQYWKAPLCGARAERVRRWQNFTLYKPRTNWEDRGECTTCRKKLDRRG